MWAFGSSEKWQNFVFFFSFFSFRYWWPEKKQNKKSKNKKSWQIVSGVVNDRVCIGRVLSCLKLEIYKNIKSWPAIHTGLELSCRHFPPHLFGFPKKMKFECSRACSIWEVQCPWWLLPRFRLPWSIIYRYRRRMFLLSLCCSNFSKWVCTVIIATRERKEFLQGWPR